MSIYDPHCGWFPRRTEHAELAGSVGQCSTGPRLGGVLITTTDGLHLSLAHTQGQGPLSTGTDCSLLYKTSTHDTVEGSENASVSSVLGKANPSVNVFPISKTSSQSEFLADGLFDISLSGHMKLILI